MKNSLKTTFNERKIGVFAGMCNAYSIEILATAGFDFILIDGEHGPNTLTTVLAQLQVLAAYPVDVILRIPDHDPIKLKQYLDLGVQNFLIPMIENKTQAEQIVKATRYPPEGFRGVGTALARAAKWNATVNYLQEANDNIGIMLQIETLEGVHNLERILCVDGIDGIFIGPADLAASMGHLGDLNHPEVQAVIAEILPKIKASGRAAGIFSTNFNTSQVYEQLGASFLAVGADTLLLRLAAVNLANEYQQNIKNLQIVENKY
ncbi:2-keto-3-deoxy-L-rhamnonate aldolase [Gammaproteobacteria bacterium]|nr:2-keto-3-deoxy-L-rhamnonate aldolase [Gammaproteobacteria bacterium]